MSDKAYYRAIQQLIRTGHWITDRVGQELKSFDITEPQFNVLRILKGRKGVPCSVQEIQAEMVQRSSNVTRIIDKLLAKGLVIRQECPTNRRKMDINLTKAGEALLLELNEKVDAFHAPMGRNLSVEEAETLEKLIKQLKGE